MNVFWLHTRAFLHSQVHDLKAATDFPAALQWCMCALLSQPTCTPIPALLGYMCTLPTCTCRAYACIGARCRPGPRPGPRRNILRCQLSRKDAHFATLPACWRTVGRKFPVLVPVRAEPLALLVVVLIAVHHSDAVAPEAPAGIQAKFAAGAGGSKQRSARPRAACMPTCATGLKHRESCSASRAATCTALPRFTGKSPTRASSPGGSPAHGPTCQSRTLQSPPFH